jgi:hypothetical protein
MDGLETGRKRAFALATKASFFCAAFATLISATLIVILPGLAPRYGDVSSAPTMADIVKSIALMCVITSVSFGVFGFLAGFAGALWLRFRRNKIKSKRRLFVEAAIVGLLAAVIFPFFDAAMNLAAVGAFRPSAQAMMSLPFSIVCATLCAFALRRRFLAA